MDLWHVGRPIQEYSAAVTGWLLEGQTATLEGWATDLACTTDEARSLVENGVLQPKGPLYSLRFVGILSLRDSAWYCRPAVESLSQSETTVAELDRARRLFQTYQVRSAARRTQVAELYDSFVFNDDGAYRTREIEILAALIEWTSSYGIHRERKMLHSSGSHSNVNWPMTVAARLPVMCRTALIFDDPISTLTSDAIGFVGAAQANAINTLASKYGGIAELFWREDFDFGSISKIASDHSITVTSASLDDLWQELNGTNRDHDKELINLLIAYFGHRRDLLPSRSPLSLFGTINFPLVWEDVCRSGFGATADSAGRLSNPIYAINDKHIAVDPQRPDLIIEHNGQVWVLDAKYYPKFPQSVPALEDVRKQIFYGLSFLDCRPSLAFLLPDSSGDMVTYRGKVEMQSALGVDGRFTPVHCIGLNWHVMIDAYISRIAVDGLAERVLDVLVGT